MSAVPVGLDACTGTCVGARTAQAARPVLLDDAESADIAAVFSLLSDPGRVRIVFALVEVGETCVCDLAEMVHMSQSALSHALRLLRTSGVVTNRRDGRMTRYRVADSHIRLLLDITRQHLQHDSREAGPI